MKLSILGSGLMAKGIAVENAYNNVDVTLILPQSSIDSAKVKEEILKFVEKKYSNDLDSIMSKIEITNDFYSISGSNIFLECVIEDIDIKKDLILKVKKFLTKDMIIASNTSSLLISNIFESINYKENLIGIHFFNPVKYMKLVEIGTTKTTSTESIANVVEYLDSINKTSVKVMESKGYIVNRLLLPMINEASKILDEGLATKEDIDKAMKLGANHPIGPLGLSDLIGNDVTLAILNELKEKMKLDISKEIKNKVNNNQLGRKTKSGFYNY